MCEPTTISLAIMAAATAYGVYTTKQNAKRQEKAQRAVAKAQSDQIYDKNSAEANQRNMQARAERARLRAVSAEGGVAGLSIEDVLNNVDFQAGSDVAAIQNNTTNMLNTSALDEQSRLNQIEQPDYIAAGLQIAGSYYNSSNKATV